ncbi:HEPN/Toprim-associated domain-containing protein [Acinetobacter sp. 197]|uniref:HEPN/Toprim-associated domain-containing protein n=1 Tax=Acinetobacter sp. 197 TaxID=3114696 RepID=UPI003A89DE32
MGSWTELMLEDMPLFHTKSYVHPELMLIFRESDKKVFDRKCSERSRLVWGNLSDSEYEEAFEYQCKLKLIKERLNLFGFNFEDIKNKFDFVKNEYIDQNYSLLIEEKPFSDYIKKLDSLSFDDYCSYLIYFYQNRYILNDSSNEIFNLLNKEITHDKEVFTFSYDIREIIVLFSHLLTGEERIIQDLTEVTNAGYYDIESNVVKNCEELISKSSKPSEQIYIFTEGSTDRFILEESLKILFPHLYDFFEFIDYQASSLDGGAHILTKMVKAFVGAKMPNKILAIYDSDTAALESLNLLSKITLPSNIKVTKYPDFDLLKNYPTLGPNGQFTQDIYSKAASIELYVGRDCITDQITSEYYPIIWRSFNDGLNQYQGEISNKKRIFENFKDKIKSKNYDNPQYDWSGLTLIWKHIFKLVGEMQ